MAHDRQKLCLRLGSTFSSFFCLLQRFFPTFSLYELTDLAPMCCHHLQQVVIRFLDLMTERLDDSCDFAAKKDRKAKRTMKVTARGCLCSREVGVLDDINNPCGATVGPYAAW